jgi:hypothetical protein
MSVRQAGKPDLLRKSQWFSLAEMSCVQVAAFSRNPRKRQCQSPFPPIIESLTGGLQRIVESTTRAVVQAGRSVSFLELLFEVHNGDEDEAVSDFPLNHEAALPQVQEIIPRRLVDHIVTGAVRFDRIREARMTQGVPDQLTLPVIQLGNPAQVLV